MLFYKSFSLLQSLIAEMAKMKTIHRSSAEQSPEDSKREKTEIPMVRMLRKYKLCVPFLGIARPKSHFPHSRVCERFIYSIPRIGPHIFLVQNRQTGPGNI